MSDEHAPRPLREIYSREELSRLAHERTNERSSPSGRHDVPSMLPARRIGESLLCGSRMRMAIASDKIRRAKEQEHAPQASERMDEGNNCGKNNVTVDGPPSCLLFTLRAKHKPSNRSRQRTWMEAISLGLRNETSGQYQTERRRIILIRELNRPCGRLVGGQQVDRLWETECRHGKSVMNAHEDIRRYELPGAGTEVEFSCTLFSVWAGTRIESVSLSRYSALMQLLRSVFPCCLPAAQRMFHCSMGMES